ncbi:MAG: hypothetical protein JXA44_12370 [Methanospirillaceae archaeon]|nr:hypothetical protein [Methanospirillaceae archaeon]
MDSKITIEIIGYMDMECSPFPCTEERTCGLSPCAPSNKLLPAVSALKEAIYQEYGDSVSIQLTLIDETVPGYVTDIYNTYHPAFPIILVNSHFVPIGRISYPQIKTEIDKLTGIPQYQ